MAEITGVHSEGGVVVSGYLVCCYDYGSDTIANLTALVDSDTTGVDGSWSLTTLNTNKHLTVITDPNNVKQGLAFFATPG